MMNPALTAGSVRPDRFELVSDWHLDAPVALVWHALKHTEYWPAWWPYVETVETLREGDNDGLGAKRHIRWSSRLPYGIEFDVEVVEVERERLIRGRATGQLVGEGLWLLRPDGATTHVRYEWRVDLHESWMRRVAPLAAPVFRWNHDGVMQAGAHGLASFLKAKLLQS